MPEFCNFYTESQTQMTWKKYTRKFHKALMLCNLMHIVII